MIYLDTAATNQYRDIDDVIVSTITNAMKNDWQNPSSLYTTNIKDKINKCRANIAEFIGAKPNEIIFTSGASESNNMAIRGWVDNKLINTLQMINVITTPIEHKSIMEAVKNDALGARIRYCNVDEFGLIDLQDLEAHLHYNKNEPTLVVIGMANSEIGTVQNIKQISDLVHRYNGVLYVDATQAIPYMAINVEKLGIDMMGISGHKISPVLKGIGFLYKRNNINMQPLIYGAQENGLRGGTENTFGIVGLNEAIQYCKANYKNIANIKCVRDYLILMLSNKFGCKLNGSHFNRLPNNVNVTFPQNITGESLLYTLDMSDIKISTGSACNSTSIKPSYVLKAIGLSDSEAMRTIRITLSEDTTYEDIEKLMNEIDKAIKIIEV